MDNMQEDIAYRDLPTHVLRLTDSEMKYLYNLVGSERKQLKEWISRAQYLQQEVPVKQYEWLDALYRKLAKHHHGALNLNE